MRTAGVRSVSVGAVGVGASKAAASVGVAAVRQTGTLMVVSPGLFFKKSIRQLLAISLVSLLTCRVVLVAVSTNAGRVASRAIAVGVNTRISLVSKVRVVRAGGIAAVSGAVACSAMRASQARAGGTVSTCRSILSSTNTAST